MHSSAIRKKILPEIFCFIFIVHCWKQTWTHCKENSWGERQLTVEFHSQVINDTHFCSTTVDFKYQLSKSDDLEMRLNTAVLKERELKNRNVRASLWSLMLSEGCLRGRQTGRNSDITNSLESLPVLKHTGMWCGTFCTYCALRRDFKSWKMANFDILKLKLMEKEQVPCYGFEGWNHVKHKLKVLTLKTNRDYSLLTSAWLTNIV